MPNDSRETRANARARNAARRQSFLSSSITEAEIRTYIEKATSLEDLMTVVSENEKASWRALWAVVQDWKELDNSLVLLQHQVLDLEKKDEKIEKLEKKIEKLKKEKEQMQELLDSRTTPSATREQLSQKLPTPAPFTDGKTGPTFDHWKRSVRNVLTANGDRYTNESSKIAFVISCIGQPASDVLEPYLDEGTSNIPSWQELVRFLEQVYGEPDKERLYESKFQQLSQGTTDFPTFCAEFYRLSAPLGRDPRALLSAFRDKLTPTMYDKTIGKEFIDLADCVRYLRVVDVDLRAKRLRNPFPTARTTTATATGGSTGFAPRTMTPGLAIQAPAAGTATTTRARPPGVFTNTTVAERTQMRASGQCFRCKQAGHIAPNCPQRASQNLGVRAIATEEGGVELGQPQEQMTENETPRP